MQARVFLARRQAGQYPVTVSEGAERPRDRPLPAPQIEDVIDSDAKEPRPETTLLSIGRQRLDGLDQDLLCRVLRIGPMPEHAHGNVQGPGLVAHEQLLESVRPSPDGI